MIFRLAFGLVKSQCTSQGMGYNLYLSWAYFLCTIMSECVKDAQKYQNIVMGTGEEMYLNRTCNVAAKRGDIGRMPEDESPSVLFCHDIERTEGPEECNDAHLPKENKHHFISFINDKNMQFRKGNDSSNLLRHSSCGYTTQGT